MKKLLILLMPVLVATAAANAQSFEGYYWYFNNAAPFTSVPGAAGSATSYTLTTVGTGIITAPASEDLSGFGSASCTGLVGVAKYPKQSGFVFSNSPLLVTDSYTIEMTVNISDLSTWTRLAGFVAGDPGIYFPAGGGSIAFWNGSVSIADASYAFQPNTWYDIVLTRNGATKDIRTYINGVQQGAIAHDAADVFIPHTANGNQISFFKDNQIEENAGSVAKISIFNTAFTPIQVQRLYNEVCSSGLMAPAVPEGYSWYFNNAAPFTSVPGAPGSGGSYTLSPVGTGIITGPVASDISGLGSSTCAGLAGVANYPKASGLVFSNSPRIINDTYTIEMAVNISDLSTWTRLVGFLAPNQDPAIYINAGGTALDFWMGAAGGDDFITFPFVANKWYDIVITRNGATKDITTYINGVLQAHVIHDNADALTPTASTNYPITFFKDNNGEENAGSVAKISIFDHELTAAEVQTLFNNVCGAGLLANASPQGYQWTFGSTTYKAVGTDAHSEQYASNYTLTGVGSGSSSIAGPEVLGLGASCSTGINVTEYTQPNGFRLNQNPQFIDASYTMELDIKTGYLENAVRLAGFANGSSDGIYINASTGTGNAIYFQVNGSSNSIGVSLNSDSWYSFVFTRDAGTKNINVYLNNVFKGTYNDGGDTFVPHASSGNSITFFKNNVDFVDEDRGSVAKLSLFNRVLNTTQLTERYNNICNTNLIILPVTLKNFNAQKAGSKVNLSWTTAAEQNSKGFEVQRSADGTNYTAIGFVNGAGNSTTDINYHFADASPLPGKSYYRLKQINIDNQFKVSATRLIDFAKDVQDLQVYPNPTHSLLTVVNLKTGNALRIFDSFGRFVYGKNITDTEETIPVDKLAAGVYVLQVTDSNGNKRSVRFTRF